MFAGCLGHQKVEKLPKKGPKSKNFIVAFFGTHCTIYFLEFTIMPFMSSYVRGIIQILNKLMNENILNGNLDLIQLMKLR